jgi:hypothetical protein
VFGVVGRSLSTDLPSLKTVFYRERRGEQTEEIVAPLARGTALLHR